MAAQDEEQLGWNCLNVEDYDGAERHFRRALELEPFRAESLNGLGMIYLVDGELDQARELFEMALTQAERHLPRKKRTTGWEDPEVRPYLRGLFYLALTNAEDGEWDHVGAPLEELIAWDIQGMDGDAYFLLAQAYHRTGQWEQAVHAYLEAGERRPEAFYSIGLIYFQWNRLRDAERFWLRALRRQPHTSFLITRYPRVRPIRVGRDSDQEFYTAAQYIDANADLWTEEARRALERVCQQQVAMGQG